MSGALALALALATAAAPPPARETPAARDEARRCARLTGEEGVAACRRALELGLAPPRSAAVRRTLAAKLSTLGRPGEAIEVYREAARVDADDAGAHWRLGQALLALAGEAEAALAALQRAQELAPEDPRVHVTRGEALAARGRLEEAVSAFEAALKLDPEVLTHRPGARAAYEAARRGERWPPKVRPTPAPP